MEKQKEVDMLVKYLKKEQKLIKAIIKALSQEDNFAIEFLQEEYKKIKEETDKYLNEICIDIRNLDTLKKINEQIENTYKQTDYSNNALQATNLISIEYYYNFSKINPLVIPEENLRNLLNISVYYFKNNELSPAMRNRVINLLAATLSGSKVIRELLEGNIEFANNFVTPELFYGIFTNNISQKAVNVLLTANLINLKGLSIKKQQLEKANLSLDMVKYLFENCDEKQRKLIKDYLSSRKEKQTLLDENRIYLELELAATFNQMKKYELIPQISEGIEINPFMKDVLENANEIETKYSQETKHRTLKAKKTKIIYASN